MNFDFVNFDSCLPLALTAAANGISTGSTNTKQGSQCGEQAPVGIALTGTGGRVMQRLPAVQFLHSGSPQPEHPRQSPDRVKTRQPDQ